MRHALKVRFNWDSYVYCHALSALDALFVSSAKVECSHCQEPALKGGNANDVTRLNPVSQAAVGKNHVEVRPGADY